jgi:hypothetical protein
MKKYQFFDDDNEYFEDYINSVEYELLKDRLIWQRHIRKKIQLDYQLIDDDIDFFVGSNFT